MNRRIKLLTVLAAGATAGFMMFGTAAAQESPRITSVPVGVHEASSIFAPSKTDGWDDHKDGDHKDHHKDHHGDHKDHHGDHHKHKWCKEHWDHCKHHKHHKKPHGHVHAGDGSLAPS